MNKRVVTLFTNNTKTSMDTVKLLSSKLEESGFSVSHELTPGSELIICVGGDGTFLSAVHRFGFPAIPFVGVNTGHLGFFQEVSTSQIDSFIENYKKEQYHIQHLKPVKADVTINGEIIEHVGVNEIVIKASGAFLTHLNVSIGGCFIQRFSGDGILVATPAGSTAYNYSLGGSIVDPRLNLLQVTPIAPMNSTAYRSFTSSILLPPGLSIGVAPESEQEHSIAISTDGFEHRYDNISQINIYFAESIVNLIRFEAYDFWNKVKTKFLDG
ncbi:MAG: NAD(+)/NADH kinase, partial [Clostridiales bacterium]|nr:NAD(+)/NADH kinase [Clostridiales bacterium]